MALHQIGFLPESEVITDPDTFGAGRLDGPMPRNPEELRALVMVSNCLEREFIHRQLATGQPLHMNVL